MLEEAQKDQNHLYKLKRQAKGEKHIQKEWNSIAEKVEQDDTIHKDNKKFKRICLKLLNELSLRHRMKVLLIEKYEGLIFPNQCY